MRREKENAALGSRVASHPDVPPARCADLVLAARFLKSVLEHDALPSAGFRNPIALPDSPRDTANNARAALDCLASLIGNGRDGLDLDVHEAYGLALLLECVSEALGAEATP